MTSILNKPLCLASNSPRRAELLSQIDIAYEQQAADVDERQHSDEVPELYVLRLALEKARAVAAQIDSDAYSGVLGADTSVVLHGEILGKPRDRQDAVVMLSGLSGQTHEVYTGVALINADGEAATRLSVNRVRFRPLEADEIAAYWASGEPADKAGAYAIQGRGAVFIEHLEGSYSGVMGLPLFETAQLLHQAGVTAIMPGGQ